MNSNIKTGIFWIILACVAILLWQVVKQAKTRPDKQLSFTHFVSEVEAGKIEKVTISNATDVKGV
ncbi:MAG: ATP-dependent metallopeptidase FtsH/Yme1/Tma family protein, partial [Bryobacteraceae bacterium]